MKVLNGLLAAMLAVVAVQPAMAEAAPYKDRKYYEARGEVVWEVRTDEKVIALTFDDGPDPVHTPLILDLLKQYEAKATFFVVGNKVKLNPQLALREVQEGHEIANHTYSHLYFGKSTSVSKIEKELDMTQQAIMDAAGVEARYFRPPGGQYNEQLVNAAKRAGFLVVMWSWHQDTHDWRSPGTARIVNKVLSNAKNGDIVLFHDYVEKNSQTVEALKQILPELKQRGYKFVTISELLTYRKTEPVKSQ